MRKCSCIEAAATGPRPRSWEWRFQMWFHLGDIASHDNLSHAPSTHRVPDSGLYIRGPQRITTSPPPIHTHLNDTGILKMKSLKLREVKPPAQGHMATTEWSQDTAAYSVTPKPWPFIWACFFCDSMKLGLCFFLRQGLPHVPIQKR